MKLYTAVVLLMLVSMAVASDLKKKVWKCTKTIKFTYNRLCHFFQVVKFTAFNWPISKHKACKKIYYSIMETIDNPSITCFS